MVLSGPQLAPVVFVVRGQTATSVHSPTVVPVERYPMPRSSMRSTGVPHSRQISARQSPHTSGFNTAFAQVGQ